MDQDCAVAKFCSEDRGPPVAEALLKGGQKAHVRICKNAAPDSILLFNENWMLHGQAGLLCQTAMVFIDCFPTLLVCCIAAKCAPSLKQLQVFPKLLVSAVLGVCFQITN